MTVIEGGYEIKMIVEGPREAVFKLGRLHEKWYAKYIREGYEVRSSYSTNWFDFDSMCFRSDLLFFPPWQRYPLEPMPPLYRYQGEILAFPQLCFKIYYSHEYRQDWDLWGDFGLISAEATNSPTLGEMMEHNNWKAVVKSELKNRIKDEGYDRWDIGPESCALYKRILVDFMDYSHPDKIDEAIKDRIEYYKSNIFYQGYDPDWPYIKYYTDEINKMADK